MLKTKILIKVFLICNLLIPLGQFVICNFTFSQPVHQEWVARYPGPFNDLIGPFFACDPNGNSYVGGTHVINDSINILCVKYNSSGVQQWATLYKYPGNGYFAPSGMAIDLFGNAYIIAYYSYNLNTLQSILTLKFNNSNGSIAWARSYTGQYNIGSGPNDIKIDRSNNIYVVGYSDTSHLVIRYNIDGDSVWVRKYHPPPVPPLFPREVARACTIDDSLNIIFTGVRIDYYPPQNFEYDSLLVVKYSSSGILNWESVYSTNLLAEHVGTKIVADQNGNLYIGGSTTISGNGVYLTLKYDRNGLQQWAKIHQGPGLWDNNLNGIALDRINNALFVTGNSQVSGSTTYGVTIKYNITNGDSLWVRNYGMNNYISRFNDIIIDSLGNSYIAGGSGPYNSTGDVLTIKYSSQGNQIWFITYNGPYNGGDGAYNLRLDNLNNVYVMGESQSSSQIYDYIVIKYSQLSGIKTINNEIPKKFELYQNYPNPFNPITKIKFSIPKSSFIQLKIYDILGRVKNIPVNEKLQTSEYELTLDATNYSSGVYFYQLFENGNIIDTKKMIVLK